MLVYGWCGKSSKPHCGPRRHDITDRELHCHIVHKSSMYTQSKPKEIHVLFCVNPYKKARGVMQQ